MMNTVPELISASFKQPLKGIAIVYNNQRIVYSQLSNKINNFSKFLLQMGLGKQDRVAIFLPNNPSFVVSFFAIAKIGAIALTLNINYTQEELKKYLKYCKIKYVITDYQKEQLCRTAAGKLPVKIFPLDSWVNFVDTLRIQPSSKINIKINPQDQVLYQFSSGSTGIPKIASRSQHNVAKEIINISKTIKISNKDKIICVVPLWHAYGLIPAMALSVYSKATLVLVDKFYPRKILNILNKEKATIFYATPYMLNALSRMVKRKIKLPDLKFCFTAGAPLSKKLARGFYNKFGLFPQNFYGTTETGCVSINLDKNRESTIDSVGLPISNTKIKILLEDKKTAKVGYKGQVIIKTPACAQWYYLGDRKEPLLKDGYFYTGDLGKKDKRGNLYILGRKTYFINVGGIKVDSAEVEEVIKKFPLVKEALVMGAPDKLRGQIVKAVIMPKGASLDAKVLLKYCREKLADFKIPRIIEIRDKFSNSPLGKTFEGCL